MRRVRWSGVFAGAGVLVAAYIAFLVVSPLVYALLGPDWQGGFSISPSIPLEGLLGETWPLVIFNIAFLISSNVAAGAVSGRRAHSAPGLSGTLAVVVAPFALLGLFALLTVPFALFYLLDGSTMDWGEGVSNLLILAAIFGVVVCVSSFFGFLGGVLGGKLGGRSA